MMPKYVEYLAELWGAGAFWFQRKKRNEPPFKLYVGKRGRGKSLMLTRDVQRELAKGALVIANFRVYDPRSRRYADEFESMTDLMQQVAQAVLRNERRIILAVDEAQNHFDARDWDTCPRWFRQFLAESRHYHVGVLAATQSITQVDKRFRILCDQVVRVRPVVEGFHHRLALFRCVSLSEDFDSADDDARELGLPWLSYVTARCFAGYATGSLPSDECVAAGDDSAVQALIASTRRHVSSPDALSSVA